MSKYKAKRVKIGNISFDSKREAKRYTDLQLLERGGEISELQLQVPIYLEGRDGPILTPTGRKMRYVADFTYVEKRTGETTIEDAKGFPTPEYKIKRAILKAMGVNIVEV